MRRATYFLFLLATGGIWSGYSVAFADDLPSRGIRSERRAMVASCTGDSRYSVTTTIRIAKAIEKGGEWTARVSLPLQPTWNIKSKALLLGPFESGVVVIHLSCFSRTQDPDEDIGARDSAFRNFLTDLRDDKSIKVFVYSRVFNRYPDYLRSMLRQSDLCKSYSGRIAAFPIKDSNFPGESIEADASFKASLNRLLYPASGLDDC